jgi:hypothetical protein
MNSISQIAGNSSSPPEGRRAYKIWGQKKEGRYGKGSNPFRHYLYLPSFTPHRGTNLK